MPQAIHLGPLTIRLYGIIIMLGALAAAYLAERLAKRKGMNFEFIWDALPWVLIGGIVGARLWHIFTPSMMDSYTTMFYLTHPLDALAVWNGGLGIPGAVMGGALALFLYARRRKESFAAWTDVIAPGLALAQGIGRWGNFVNQELYGAPTDLPWKLFIDPQFRRQGYENVAYYHPLFLYESLWNLVVMGLLLWIGRKFSDRLKSGDIFLIYLILYPTARFFLEFLRLDISVVGGININQTLMAVIAISSTIALVLRHRFGKRSEPVSVVETEASQDIS
jgi:phosphatidylglycerol---prolipoprotein diacylglyceryl transferase